jgi:hypothetical protein
MGYPCSFAWISRYAPRCDYYQNYAFFFKNAFTCYFYKTVPEAWCSVRAECSHFLTLI